MGSTWIGQFHDSEVRSLLNREPDLVPVALISLGYPAVLPEHSSHRRLTDIMTLR